MDTTDTDARILQVKIADADIPGWVIISLCEYKKRWFFSSSNSWVSLYQAGLHISNPSIDSFIDTWSNSYPFAKFENCSKTYKKHLKYRSYNL